MSNYSDEIDIRQLLAGVRDRLVVRNKTEAQALVLSTTYPTSVFYTNDTNCIVVNGQIYGRGEQLPQLFEMVPLNATVGVSPYDDTTKLYLQSDNMAESEVYRGAGGGGAPAPSSGLMGALHLGSGITGVMVHLVVNYSATSVGSDHYTKVESYDDSTHTLTVTITIDATFISEACEHYYYLSEIFDAIMEIPADFHSLSTVEEYFSNISIYGSGSYEIDTQWDINGWIDITTADQSNFIIWGYNTAMSRWWSFGSYNLHFESNASTISYDLASTPDLGEGDVQSAIEAVDEKIVEEPGDALIEVYQSSVSNNEIYGTYTSNMGFLSQTKAQIAFNATVVSSGSSTSYVVSYSTIKIPKGTIVDFDLLTTTARAIRYGFALSNPADYVTENGTLIGFSFKSLLLDIATTANVPYHNRITIPETGYILYYYYNSDWTYRTINYYKSDALDKYFVGNQGNVWDFYAGLASNYYAKGVEDGSAMASIAGVGYDIIDAGSDVPIDKVGFKRACDLRESFIKTPPTGTSAANGLVSNSDIVYLPDADYSGITKVDGDNGGFLFACRNLQTVPPNINLTGSINGSNFMQAGSSAATAGKLRAVGTLGTIQFTRLASCFRYQVYLRSVGDISSNTENVDNCQFSFDNCSRLERIEGFSMKSMTTWYASGAPSFFRSCANLRYCLLKDLGRVRPTAGGGFNLRIQHWKWGLNNAENPDAKQSLIDSLITYSYDRATDPDGLGTADTTYTIGIPRASLDLLTTEEKEQITAKGYTISAS